MGISCGASVSDQDWPMYMNNVERTGVSGNTLPPTTETAWKFSTGEMRLYAPPAVCDGVAYVLGQKFFAVDASIGRELWSYPITALEDFKAANTTNWHFWSEWASPTVYGDRVFITSSMDNEIVALDRTPGDGIDESYDDPDDAGYDVIWKLPVAGQNIFGSRSSPLVVDDILYVGTAEGDLIAVDTLNMDEQSTENVTPKILWKYHVGTRIDSAPSYFDDKVYIGTWDIHNRPPEYVFDENDTYITALDATPDDGSDDGMPDETGAGYDVIWRARLGDLIWGTPTIDAETGVVYIGSTDMKMYALDAATGAEKWNFTANGPVYSAPALADDRLYFGTSEPGNSLYALEAGSGKFVWRYQADEKVAASPIVADGLVISPVMSGRVNALYPAGNGDGTTSLMWTLELGGRIRASPVLASGRLYLSCWDSNLYSIGRYPAVDLRVSGFIVEGDSSEATLEFMLLNLGESMLTNSTVYVYDGFRLIYNRTLGIFPPNGKYVIRHIMTDVEPRDHYYKIRLDYTDETGEQKIYLWNSTATIEKHVVPSFIPAPGAGWVVASITAAALGAGLYRHRRRQ